MKWIILILAVLLCTAAVSADNEIEVSHVHAYDDVLRMDIMSENEDISNARVKVVVPELGIIFPARNIDLDEDIETGIAMLLRDDIPAEEYLVRIVVTKASQRKIVHRYVDFG